VESLQSQLAKEEAESHRAKQELKQALAQCEKSDAAAEDLRREVDKLK